ncbi:MAG: glycosyltransferase family protein [Desulfobacteraceae bacterium]|nr:glycosyltransferase family protein [Desulfobacteraceae bacterium]
MTHKNTKVTAIIQARTGATRLPGKVLEELAGEPMLTRVVNRTRRAKTLDAVVVATTTQPADDVIVGLCQERDWPFFRGSENDILDRYYRAALAFQADVVVRITSDCPLIEPEIIDKIVNEFLSCYPKTDYVSNSLVPTFPRGLDVEVMSFDALKRAWHEDDNPIWREHVTPYIYHQPEKFKIRNVANDTDYSYMRWTVDTPEDLTFARKIYEHFQNDTFTWRQVLHLLELHPEWLEINRHVQQKVVP